MLTEQIKYLHIQHTRQRYVKCQHLLFLLKEKLKMIKMFHVEIYQIIHERTRFNKIPLLVFVYTFTFLDRFLIMENVIPKKKSLKKGGDSKGDNSFYTKIIE